MKCFGNGLTIAYSGIIGGSIALGTGATSLALFGVSAVKESEADRIASTRTEITPFASPVFAAGPAQQQGPKLDGAVVGLKGTF
jgi:hypothetical protein